MPYISYFLLNQFILIHKENNKDMLFFLLHLIVVYNNFALVYNKEKVILGEISNVN